MESDCAFFLTIEMTNLDMYYYNSLWYYTEENLVERTAGELKNDYYYNFQVQVSYTL